MKAERLIPYYAPDGTSLGFRTQDEAQRLVEAGQVLASWGRKGHLRAIWLPSPDGGTASRRGRHRAPSTASSKSCSTGAAGSCASWMAAMRTACRSPLAMCSCRWSQNARPGEGQGSGGRPACGLDARRVQSPTFGGVRCSQARRQGRRHQRDTCQRQRNSGQRSGRSPGANHENRSVATVLVGNIGYSRCTRTKRYCLVGISRRWFRFPVSTSHSPKFGFPGMFPACSRSCAQTRPRGQGETATRWPGALSLRRMK